MDEKKAVFMVFVTGRKLKEALLTALKELDIHFINIIYGKSAVKEGFLMNMLGLVTEENKVVATCITTAAKSEAALKMIVQKFNFDKPNTGIAFTVPIESVSY